MWWTVGFMMWMSGTTVQIFSVMGVWFLLKGAITAILNYQARSFFSLSLSYAVRWLWWRYYSIRAIWHSSQRRRIERNLSITKISLHHLSIWLIGSWNLESQCDGDLTNSNIRLSGINERICWMARKFERNKNRCVISFDSVCCL